MEEANRFLGASNGDCVHVSAERVAGQHHFSNRIQEHLRIVVRTRALPSRKPNNKHEPLKRKLLRSRSPRHDILARFQNSAQY